MSHRAVVAGPRSSDYVFLLAFFSISISISKHFKGTSKIYSWVSFSFVDVRSKNFNPLIPGGNKKVTHT